MNLCEAFQEMKQGKKYRTSCLQGYLHAIDAGEGFIYVCKSFKDNYSVAINQLGLNDILREDWEEYIIDERDTPVIIED